MSQNASMYTVVTSDYLMELGIKALSRVGISNEDAEVTIDCLVEADLRGVHSHGMIRLPSYIERVDKGGDNPNPCVRVMTETGGTALLNGDNGLGQVVSKKAMAIAIEKAREVGVGVAGVYNTHHFGGCFYWAEKALPYDMIGIATTNCGPIMAPWGGLTGSLCNNPIGVAIPAGKELPIVLDMAMSIVAGGKLDQAILKGTKIPEGWAINTNGEPTTDPQEARAGLLLPAGEYKGYGAMVILEVLAAVLMGARYSRHVEPRNPAVSREIGHFFQAIDVAAFIPITDFKNRVDDLIHLLKSSRLAPGHERILLPGEIEFENRNKYRQEGIPMITKVIHELITLAN